MKIERKVPFKNYIILAFVIIASIMLTIYFYMWHKEYERQKLKMPIIDEYLSVIQYNELDNYLVENSRAIIYVSVLNDERIRDFEKKFKRLIDKYSINNSILYLNITDELDNTKIYQEIKEKYSIDVPYIMIFSDGVVSSIFKIKENNYNINLLKEFLINEGVIDD